MPSHRKTAVLLAAALALPLVACAHSPPPIVSSHLATVEVYDRHDNALLPVYVAGGERWIVGTPGHEYAIRIRNHTGQRILAVPSVDGVNAITGETARANESGYVLSPYESTEIEGWRKNMNEIAAFEFTALSDSYAARTGRPNNVGVIGVAVFREKAPPVVYRPREDRIASRDAPSGRNSTLADAAPAARQEAATEVDRAVGKVQRAAPSSPLGTGHGRSETSYAQSVTFERASTIAAETVTIQYDRRDNLIAMGVIPGSRYAQRAPQAFPAMRFAPDPR